ncbi:Kazal-type serine protease inhibitor [Flavobacteriaceae bacterium]|nr:Kazal-type serine protease inhibitor [Flavobacteriaceae bacterium]
MRSIKVISFISLVVLGLSTISCKDELVDVSCVDETKRIAYDLEVQTILDNIDEEILLDEDFDVGMWTYYSPVCGCDNKTYPNDHFAKLEGIFIFTEGDCEN